MKHKKKKRRENLKSHPCLKTCALRPERPNPIGVAVVDLLIHQLLLGLLQPHAGSRSPTQKGDLLFFSPDERRKKQEGIFDRWREVSAGNRCRIGWKSPQKQFLYEQLRSSDGTGRPKRKKIPPESESRRKTNRGKEKKKEETTGCGIRRPPCGRNPSTPRVPDRARAGLRNPRGE